jgi:O-antigen ligase
MGWLFPASVSSVAGRMSPPPGLQDCPARVFRKSQIVELVAKQRLVSLAGGIAAVGAGWQIAHGSYGLSALLASLLVLWIASGLLHVPVDVVLFGVVLIGYLVGNRGFAQVHSPGLPLFPGEIALSLGLVFTAWRTARTKILPVRFDGINLLVALWIAIGLVHLPADWRQYHFMALRDFAMVYYALFFFLGQGWAEDLQSRRWLIRCLDWGLGLAAPVFGAFLLRPDWFLTYFVVAGIPLVYVKSDVAGGFFAMAACWFAWRSTARPLRWGSFLLAAWALAGVAYSNNRAAAVGLLLSLAWLVATRVWRTLRPVMVLLAIGAVVLAGDAAFGRRSFEQSRLNHFVESALSVTDINGVRPYRSDEVVDKPDNNRFRLAWWRTVAGETYAQAPWLGLGFGYDLADSFLRTYYPEGSDEFSARSPHNIMLSIFGRMGLAGLLPFLALIGFVASRTWQAGQRARENRESDPTLSLWLGVWAILGSACFGVVLESPMGAIVFWSIIGMANGISGDATGIQDAGSKAPAAEEDPSVPTAAAHPALQAET